MTDPETAWPPKVFAALARVEARLEAAERALTQIADAEGVGHWKGWISDGDEMRTIARRALAGKDAA